MEKLSELAKITKIVDDHTRADDRNFSIIHEKLAVIKDNHLFHIEKSVAEIAGHISTIKTDLQKNTNKTEENTTNISWLKWIGVTAVGALIVGAVASVYK